MFKNLIKMGEMDIYGRTAEQIRRDKIMTEKIKDFLKEKHCDSLENLGKMFEFEFDKKGERITKSL